MIHPSRETSNNKIQSKTQIHNLCTSGFSSGVKSASDWSLKREPEGIIGTGFCRPDAYVVQTTNFKAVNGNRN